MPEKLETTHQIIPRELIIYLRPSTDVWQCRFKVDGRWIVKTTKERDLQKAKDRAKRLMIEAEIRKASNIPVVTKKFRDIAKLAKLTMENETKNGKAIASYKQYAQIIDDFLIPFFGNKNIDSINHAVLEEYEVWRTEKMGRTLAYSTVRKHNVTLNRIFDEAIHRSYLTKIHAPHLETKGRQAETYPTFEIAEVNALLANFPAWIKQGSTVSKQEQRQMLFDYVQILTETGARPGKELLDLQWKNIRYRVNVVDVVKKVIGDNGEVIELKDDGYDDEGNLITFTEWQPTVTLSVDGKTGDRKVNGFEETYRVLNEIVARNYSGKEVTLKKLTETNNEDLVFVTKSGAIPSSFNHLFERYLSEHNLLIDPNNGRKRVFYSLRSTYATTVMNLDGVPIRDLSKQLGNSVGIIQKHYDRATGDAISENIRAPNAKQALFNTENTREIYKSNKKPK